MAARRLIVVMLVLLGISTAIAMIVPEPENRDPDQPAATTGATGATDAGEPVLVEDDESRSRFRRARVGGEDDDPEVKVQPGDRLQLTVDPGRPVDVEIADLGLFATATAHAPAVFDVMLPPDEASYEVTEVGAKPPLATIEAAYPSDPANERIKERVEGENAPGSASDEPAG